jgi:hypothetical protein
MNLSGSKTYKAYASQSWTLDPEPNVVGVCFCPLLQKEKVERVKNFVSTIRTANVLQASLSFHTSHVFVGQKVDVFIEVIHACDVCILHGHLFRCQ